MKRTTNRGKLSGTKILKGLSGISKNLRLGISNFLFICILLLRMFIDHFATHPAHYVWKRGNEYSFCETMLPVHANTKPEAILICFEKKFT